MDDGETGCAISTFGDPPPRLSKTVASFCTNASGPPPAVFVQLSEVVSHTLLTPPSAESSHATVGGTKTVSVAVVLFVT